MGFNDERTETPESNSSSLSKEAHEDSESESMLSTVLLEGSDARYQRNFRTTGDKRWQRSGKRKKALVTLLNLRCGYSASVVASLLISHSIHALPFRKVCISILIPDG